jgi:hypothetical protein
MLFKKATRKGTKLRMAIQGVSGSGKTMTALKIAGGLCPGGMIGVIDTEHGSAAKFAGLPGISDFQHCEMEPPFHPDRIVEAIAQASIDGFDVLIIDSLSHMWTGTGGLLEAVDNIAARSKSQNTYTAWKDATPIQNKMIDAIIRANIHIIVTLRTKTEYVIEQKTGANGKSYSVPKKVGMAPVQRDGLEYEFDIVAEMTADHELIIVKTRCPAIDSQIFDRPGSEVGTTLREWLDGAEPIEPRVEPFLATNTPPDAPKPQPATAGIPDSPVNRAAVLKKLHALIDEVVGKGIKTPTDAELKGKTAQQIADEGVKIREALAAIEATTPPVPETVPPTVPEPPPAPATANFDDY